MLGALGRLILYRLLGARIMIGLAILGWLRRQLGGRRDAQRLAAAAQPEQESTQPEQESAPPEQESAPLAPPAQPGQESAYQPSQGASQTEQREPR